MKHDAPCSTVMGATVSWTVVRETRKGDLECSLGATIPSGATALSVGSELAAGDTKGAVTAGVFGAVGTKFSIAAKALDVGYRASVAVAGTYTALGIGAGLAQG